MLETIVWQYGGWGALGGFVSVIVKCGYIELPAIRDRRLYLGGFTGIVLGCVAGLIGDSNAPNAFMWGAGGSAILQGLVTVAEKQASGLCNGGTKP